LDKTVTESTGSTQQKPNRIRAWIKRLGILAALLAILIGVNVLYASIAETEAILEGDAGDLLYVSAFDGFLDEWQDKTQIYEGQQSAQIIDDTLQIDVSVPNQEAWSVANPIFKDFDLTLKATPIEGPIDNAFGIIFRLQTGSDQACDLPMIVLCIADGIPIAKAGVRLLIDSTGGSTAKNYYTFLISSDGYYSVWKVENGVESKLSAWIKTPAIKQDINAENTLRVVGRGSQFQFFINGEQMQLCIPNDPEGISTYAGGECFEGTMQSVLVDDSIPTGQLGALAQATLNGGGGVSVQFDNMTVFSPAKNIESNESNA
jgi:hypothetical protein